MPRHPRLVIPGTPHHVYARGNNRRRLFSSSVDRQLYVRCLARALELTGCWLHQLTLMTNHIHLVITPPDRSALASVMQRSGQRYAQHRNAARLASGKLFEERFHSKPIVDDAQLMTTTLYNDANGFRAGLVGDPTGHDWSTGPLHAATGGSRIPVGLWTPSAWYRALALSPAGRAERYRALMASYAHAAIEQPALVDAGREQRDLEPYGYRVERPDRSLAREAASRWPRKG